MTSDAAAPPGYTSAGVPERSDCVELPLLPELPPEPSSGQSPRGASAAGRPSSTNENGKPEAGSDEAPPPDEPPAASAVAAQIAATTNASATTASRGRRWGVDVVALSMHHLFPCGSDPRNRVDIGEGCERRGKTLCESRRVLKIAIVADEYVVRDNAEELRYEILRGDEVVGGISYRLAPGVIVLVHTDVAPSEEGHGVGSRLVSGALEDIRTRGLRVAPVCPFVTAYLRRHPEQRDLVTGDPATPD